MRVTAYAMLLMPLLLSCDTVKPTESGLAVRPHYVSGDELSETALVVGNFIPMSSMNSILRYDASGRFVDVMTNLSLPNGPRGGCCLTFGPDEKLYVSAGGGALAGHVNRFNGVTGELIDQFVAPGSGGLSRPLVVVFGPDGNLYVGDIGSRSIRRYDGHTGAFIDHFVPPGNLGNTGATPQLFVFGPDGNLYVVSPALNGVRRFNGTSGAFIDDFVTGTVDEPVNSGLTFGPDGHLYVGVGNGVNRYDGLTGALLGAFVAQGSGGLAVPVGMVFGPDGNFYVASPGSVGDGSVLRFDGRTGAFLDAFVPSTEPHITGPRLLAFKSTITMCHRPPGNPANQQTISTGYLTADSHVQHGDAVGACPWSAPVNLGSPVNSSGAEIEVSVSSDDLSLYIASNRSGGFDIWVSHRDRDDEPWGEPQKLGPAINTSGREQAPFISRDGRSLYFFSDRDAIGGQTDIYVSRRHDKRDDSAWEVPVNLGSGVNGTANETLPVLFENDATGTTTLYFSSNRAGSPGSDIYASTRQADGTFGPAVVVAELSSPRRDRVLAIRRDGLEIFLASDRPNLTNAPFDLWVATRATTSHPWSTPVNLGPPVNSSADEGAAGLSFDAQTLYFTSSRPGGSGAQDLWVTTRSKPRLQDD
ncbi:MAG TPA: hypothetical protein VFU01_02615 [Gemmatimonadaceae bacterium]|nr:hypothetical protein [Gemmatimonadaceae bacterium]